MQIEKMNIDDLQEADYNPRVALAPGMPEYEKLKKSLQNFGFVETPVFNKQTGRLVGGHQRVRVAKDLGYTEIQVSIVDLTEEKEKALNVALNKISGSWDDEKLAELLSSLEDDMIDLTGFDTDELLALMPESEDNVDEDDLDLDAEVPEDPFTEPGDIWQLGRHRLICGDSTKASTIQELVGSDLIDLILTDPPYNVAYESDDGKTIQNDKMEDSAFYEFLYRSFQAAASKLKPGGSFYIWHADIESANFRLAATNAGLIVHQGLVWVKNSMNLGRSDYQWRHEPCLYGWKEGAAHYFITDRTQDTVIEDKIQINQMTKEQLKKTVKELLDYGPPSTIIREDKPQLSAEHPTMKPVKLMARQIINSSKIGENVLDPFGGSGSTLIAAEQLNRSCYTVELDERYADVIVKRYMKYQGGSEGITLIRDGQPVDQDEWETYLF